MRFFDQPDEIPVRLRDGCDLDYVPDLLQTRRDDSAEALEPIERALKCINSPLCDRQACSRGADGGVGVGNKLITGDVET